MDYIHRDKVKEKKLKFTFSNDYIIIIKKKT